MSTYPDARVADVHRAFGQSANPDLIDSEHLEDAFCESISFDESVPDSDSHPSNLSHRPPSIPVTTAPQPLQSKHPMRYAFSQVFGETFHDPHSYITYGDLISSVRINPDATMIAAGDMAGRIVILSRSSANSQRKPKTQYLNDSLRGKWSLVDGTPITCDYDSLCSDDNDDDFRPTTFIPDRPTYEFALQFYAHRSLVEVLHNTEVDESVSTLCWAPGAASHTLVSSNGAEIKVWGIQEKKINNIISMNPSTNPSRRRRQVQSRRHPSPSFHPDPGSATNSSLTHNSSLKFPRLEFERYSTIASAKHTYQIELVSIHSLSLNSDARTLLAADQFQINVLSLENYNYRVCLLDLDTRPIKTYCNEIVAASFHPSNCNLLAYANESATTRVYDLRDRNAMKQCVSKLEEPKSGRKHSTFFSAIASTISDFKFSRTGPFLLTRDYMNLRLWDVRMERAPVLRIPVHDHLRSRMCDLFQNDCFRDKFDCCFSSDGGSLLTGSYNGMFQAFSAEDGSCSATEANLDTISGLSGRQHFSPEGLSASLHANSSVPELVDETKRVMKLDASKDEDIVAVAAGPGIFVYQGVNSVMNGGHDASEG